MLIYVAHEFGGNGKNVDKAAQITHDLQMNDTANTYICPLIAFSHIAYGELGYEEEMEHCFELLAVCDELVVASERSNGVELEILEAQELGIDIRYLK